MRVNLAIYSTYFINKTHNHIRTRYEYKFKSLILMKILYQSSLILQYKNIIIPYADPEP